MMSGHHTEREMRAAFFKTLDQIKDDLKARGWDLDDLQVEHHETLDTPSIIRAAFANHRIPSMMIGVTLKGWFDQQVDYMSHINVKVCGFGVESSGQNYSQRVMNRFAELAMHHLMSTALELANERSITLADDVEPELMPAVQECNEVSLRLTDEHLFACLRPDFDERALTGDLEDDEAVDY